MEPITLDQLCLATGGTLLGGVPSHTRISAVSTDSRKLHDGCLFIPLVGERFDGHDYIPSALQAGAAGCLTAREPEQLLPGKFYVRVADTRQALVDLAAWYRRQFDIPVVAVTGSVGKTTTKDMIAAVLGEKYRVLKTDGNFNNGIGLPQTLLRLNDGHQIAVIEMGMSERGEISALTHIARPDVAVITNIGDAHMETLGSREAILAAKSEIFEDMPAGGLAVLNGDDPMLRTLEGTLPMPITWCGLGEHCTWRGTDLVEEYQDHLEFTLHTPDSEWRQEVPSLGHHMVYPAAMAAAIGRRFGLTDDQIRRGITEFEPTKMRMAVLHRGNQITILNDTYNANPQSMRAAVDVLAKLAAPVRIAVLGDMLELGPIGPVLHESVGQFLGRSGVEQLITVGELGSSIADGAESVGMTDVHRCRNREEAQALLLELLRPGCIVLCKASRGMRFERIVDFLVEHTPESPG